MTEARERLAAARLMLASGFEPVAVSAAYYAMLYAARAALSEEDRYAKTHSGTWQVFRETFVASQRFDADLATTAQQTEKLRLGVDYDAQQVARDDAESAVELANRFVAAVEALYPD